MTTKDFCLACKATFHDECQEMWAGNLADSDFCCCGGDFSLEGDKAPVEAIEKELEAYFDGYSGSKELNDYADPISTGRKEAAKKFPIKTGMVCEWSWLRYAGGGIEPIIGCPGHPSITVQIKILCETLKTTSIAFALNVTTGGMEPTISIMGSAL